MTTEGECVTRYRVIKDLFSTTRSLCSLREKRFWLLAACMLVALSLAQGLAIGLTMARGIPDDDKIRIFPMQVLSERSGQNESASESEVVLTSRPLDDVQGFKDVEEEQVREIFMPGKTLLITMVVVFWPMVLLIKLVFDTVYFAIVGVILRLEYKVRDWITFSIWSRIPAMVLTTIAVFVAVLMLGTVSDSNHYQILAFAFWLPLPDEGSRSFDTFMYQLDIALIWVVAMQTIGFKTWSGKSTFSSLTVVLLPVMVLYGLIVYASV